MIEFFDIYLSGLLAKPTEHVRQVEDNTKGFPIQIDAKQVTLAQYDRTCKDVITAHNISEYRRRKFNLMLLPSIDIWFDAYLEGVKLTR